MAWDFSTEPEFEEKLEWMRGFVREEVYPLETLDLTYDQVRVLIRPLQEQVKVQGLWAAHLPPALGGMGFGQVRLGLMREILGQSPYAPVVFGNNAPDSGNAELLAVGIEASGNEAQRSQWLQPLLDGQLRSAFSMTEPDTAGSDPTLLQTSAVRDGEEWVINDHRAGVDAWCRHSAGRVDHGGPAHPVRALRESCRDRVPRCAGASCQ